MSDAERPKGPDRRRDATDDDIALARRLLDGAPYAALAVIDPESGHPFVSRILFATDIDGVPCLFVSDLSQHTKALVSDRRCSLLVGEPGKGDPLAHPRLTLQADAVAVPRSGEDHARLRARFLARHPTSSLYVDFPDFGFFRLLPLHGHLIAGFGKALRIGGHDFLIS
ncbi:hypothetical protein BJF93_11945 [Xaviernesmea oryzae]|uniref:CREG-like beta-barrel domain-containing protein n=1 Tax=Xaviernesmea oryzae TaxID=464029 RepID=A0A1Q9AVI3_9HYPH|nr:hypothetical protein BJF93_11945 [Xaviernesmea oryzae]SEL60526.1 Pyridoxamine 5'-phosphate oxidase [Xaviernesmea oryzae]